jgi:hypothetical protein
MGKAHIRVVMRQCEFTISQQQKKTTREELTGAAAMEYASTDENEKLTQHNQIHNDHICA